ncbi:hypothetical protein LSTR_LSTR014346 [Laodelphax striatellus]|uniref:Ig-like domain-containing protein n=2 Tax=Laodelphax striatellus TaxID=195883 RepID=A0A482XDU5_LAOST|nr:hypothetical protein LSTR_LSTR014346 [Laodelphax striatellus]
MPLQLKELSAAAINGSEIARRSREGNVSWFIEQINRSCYVFSVVKGGSISNPISNGAVFYENYYCCYLHSYTKNGRKAWPRTAPGVGLCRTCQQDAEINNSVGDVSAVPSAELSPLRGPYFDTSASKNVTALVGKTAYLNCRVRNLGNRTVSWVRHRDIHLLTTARYTYTSDQRFQSIHSPQTEDWTLQIRYPQRRDSGVYECQVSTTPPIGTSMYLSVVAPILVQASPGFIILAHSQIASINTDRWKEA